MTEGNKLPRGRHHATLSVLLVYGLAIAGVVGVWALCMGWIYPHKLTFSAPDITLPIPLAHYVQQTALEGLSGDARFAAYVQRDQVWMMVMSIAHAAGLLLMLVIQLLWRHHTAHAALPHERLTRHAIARFRLDTLFIFMVEAALGVGLWFAGLRHLHHPGVWDYTAALLPLGANWLFSGFLFRLAAPGIVSGRHGYFHRL